MAASNLQKLRHVRLDGIRHLLINRVGVTQLQERLFSVFHRETEDVRRALNNMTSDELIRLAGACDEITDEHVTNLWEEYRYGDRPSLYVLLVKPRAEKFFQPDQVIEALNKALPIVEGDDDSPSVRSAAFLDYEAIDQAVIEVRYRYEQRLDYIDPEHEQACHLYELRYSFCWLSLASGFLVLHGAPEAVRKPVRAAIESAYKLTTIKALLTKHLVERFFERSRRRRVSLFNPHPSGNRYKRVVISDDEKGVAEVPLEYSDYDIPSSLYKEEVEPGNAQSTSSLGINTREAKFHLTRPIRATQLRRWGVKLVTRILPHLQAMEEVALSSVTPVLLERASSLLRGYSKPEKAMITRLAQVAGQAIASGGTVRHDLDLPELLETLAGDLSTRLEFECPSCNLPTDALCPICHRFLYARWENKAREHVCSGCGQVIPDGSGAITCVEGHATGIGKANLSLSVFPTPALNEAVARCVNGLLPTVRYNSNEDLLLVTEGYISVLQPRVRTEYLPNDLAECSNLPAVDNLKEMQTLLQKLKEKCSFSATDTCLRCSTQRSIPCLVKLFSGVGGFRPHPHHGHEFGDVHCQVLVEGRQMLMQGVAKSSREKNVTLGSDVGRELLQQSVSGLTDTRVQLLAPIAPSLLDGQLTSQIAFLARKLGKAVVFWDLHWLSRLAKLRQTEGFEFITDDSVLKERLGL